MIWFFRFGFYSALLFISLMAVLPQQQMMITTGWDKANHALAFFVLLWLLDYSYPAVNLWSKKIVALIIYGLLIELVQSQLFGRHASLHDVLANTVGLTAYVLIRPVLFRKTAFIDTD